MQQEICHFLHALQDELSEELLCEFRSLPLSQLKNCHLGLGLHIRNRYLKKDSALTLGFTRIGVESKDDISHILLLLFYLFVKSQSPPSSHFFRPSS